MSDFFPEDTLKGCHKLVALKRLEEIDAIEHTYIRLNTFLMVCWLLFDGKSYERLRSYQLRKFAKRLWYE